MDDSYRREAQRTIAEHTKYLSDAQVSFDMKAWVFLAKAAIFALLDIAQAIREHRN